MAAKFPVLLLIICLHVAFAQGIHITGTVADSAGNRLSGASVKLVAQNLSTITGSDGSFSLDPSVVTNGNYRKGAASLSYLQKGIIHLSLGHADKVTVLVYDLSGRLLWARRMVLGPGDHAIAPPAQIFGSHVLLIKVTVAQKAFQYKSCSLQMARTGLSRCDNARNGMKEKGLAKSLAALDSLSAFMGGYLATVIPIDSFKGNYAITLDRIPFPVAADRLTTWNPGIRADKQLNLPLLANGLPERTTIYTTLNP